MKTLFIIFQYLVPQHLLSRIAGKLANANTPWLKNFLISRFSKHYGVKLEEAVHSNPGDYLTFNEFFTRALKPGARPVVGDDAIVSPADGFVSAAGIISADRILQAKGRSYSLASLLGGSDQIAAPFLDGSFATIYLSPKDYHRVHMPCTGTLQWMSYIPGKLFSVNQTTAERIPDLFARNERVVCLFETDAGPMAMVLVGAMIVAGIETVWAGQVAPSASDVSETDYRNSAPSVRLDKGEEMGRFRLGSTVIVLFGPGAVRLRDGLEPGSNIRMGESIGNMPASS